MDVDLNNLTIEDNDVDDAFNVEINDAFIGRDHELENIRTNWKDHKIFGIFGIRSVGKSRFVTEFLDSFRHGSFKRLHVNVGLLKDTNDLYSNLCALLLKEPEHDANTSGEWKNDIARSLNTANGTCYVLFFDNTEDCQDLKGHEVRDAFLDLIPNLARQCPKIKIIVTSTTKIQLSQLRKVYYSLELKPLQTTDARKLLRHVIGDIELGEYEDTIIKLSEGLPLLLLMIGSELAADQNMITPKDMVEFLMSCRLKALSREYYPPEDRIDNVYKKFIDRLEPVYLDHLTTLEYIPGSFNAEHARDLLGYDSVAMVKDQVLIYHRRRHMIDYHPESRRFNIQGILRECLSTFYTVKNLPEIRTKYCRIFSNVMKNISRRLGTVEYTKALSDFSIEQPNLQKLLTEVRYTSQDTYHFFIEMATSCTELIERFMAGDGDAFYQSCLKVADQYGRDLDKAAVNIAVGSMYTNTKGNLVHGELNYGSALTVLERNGPSLQLATAYQRMGWNMLQQARSPEAISFFQKSLAISSISGQDYELICLQSLSSMGVTLTVLGNFDDAKRYHFACLDRRKRVQGENHPSVGSTLNNIGVMYDQMEDHDNALKYYKLGLDLKRKSNAPVHAFVFSLTNTAAMYMSLKRYSEAHQLLDEALVKLNEQTVPPREALANTYDTKGKAYMCEKKFESAEKMFQKALELREDIAPDNMTYMETITHLARVNRCLGNHKESLKLSKKALKLKDKAIKAMPQNSFISECLECIAEIYKLKEGSIDKYRAILLQIEFELLRLECVYVSQCNTRGLQRIRNKMIDVKEKIKTCDAEKTKGVNDEEQHDDAIETNV